jgi:hypothetical protein
MMSLPCPPILSTSVSPYQLLIASPTIVVMGCADTFTVRGTGRVCTSCQLPPRPYSTFRKRHFTPPSIPILALASCCTPNLILLRYSKAVNQFNRIYDYDVYGRIGIWLRGNWIPLLPL